MCWCGCWPVSARCSCTSGRVVVTAGSPRAWTLSCPVTASRAPARRSKRSTNSRGRERLHVAAILAADVVERVRDLAERAHLHGLEQLLEDVAVAGGDLLQPPQCPRRFGAVPYLEF